MTWTMAGLALLLSGAARAELTQLHRVDLSTHAKQEASSLNTEAATALMRQDYGKALALATRASQADPSDPWSHYTRAQALANLQRVDDALGEFNAALERYLPEDTWGQSVALYGRALALDQAGRCKDAQAAYDKYVQFVQPLDPQAAQVASLQSERCPLPASELGRQPVRGSEPPERQPAVGTEPTDNGPRQTPEP